MEFIGIANVGNTFDNRLIFKVYSKVNDYLRENGLKNIRLLLLKKINLSPAYLITIDTQDGKMKGYSLEALIDLLYAHLLEEREKILMDREYNLLIKKELHPELKLEDEINKLRFDKILGIVNFPLVSRNPYFDFYEKFLGIHKKVGDKKIMVLSIKPFYSEEEELFVERVAKGVLHEIGHSFGLEHCKNACIMRQPKTLREWDLTKPRFCGDCFVRFVENAGE